MKELWKSRRKENWRGTVGGVTEEWRRTGGSLYKVLFVWNFFSLSFPGVVL